MHENSNLRARLEGLEVHNEMKNPPVAVEEVAIPPVRHHASSSAQKHVKPPKPPVRQMPTVQSDEGSSSTRSVTSRRCENVKNRPKDALHHPEVEPTVKSQRSSVFRCLGA